MNRTPFMAQTKPGWALMINPQSGEMENVRCAFADVRKARGWIPMIDERDLIPWRVTPMDMNLLSGPQRTNDEEDDGA